MFRYLLSITLILSLASFCSFSQSSVIKKIQKKRVNIFYVTSSDDFDNRIELNHGTAFTKDLYGGTIPPYALGASLKTFDPPSNWGNAGRRQIKYFGTLYISAEDRPQNVPSFFHVVAKPNYSYNEVKLLLFHSTSLPENQCCVSTDKAYYCVIKNNEGTECIMEIYKFEVEKLKSGNRYFVGDSKPLYTVKTKTTSQYINLEKHVKKDGNYTRYHADGYSLDDLSLKYLIDFYPLVYPDSN